MQQLEWHWNHKYQYPWVFFNNEPFSEEFQVRAFLTLGLFSILTDSPGRDFEPNVCAMLLRGSTRSALVNAGMDRRGSLHGQSRVPRCNWSGERMDDFLPAHVSLEQRIFLPALQAHGLRLLLASRTGGEQASAFSAINAAEIED